MRKIYFLLLILFVTSGCKESDKLSSDTSGEQAVKNCPPGLIFNEKVKRCVAICTSNQIFDPLNNECMEVSIPVPKSCEEDLVFDQKNNGCICPGRSKRGDRPNSCVCPQGMYYRRGSLDCECYDDREEFNPLFNTCTPICTESEELQLISNSRNYRCIPKCEQGYTYDFSEKRCLEVCVGNSFRLTREIGCTKGKKLPLYPGDYSILHSLRIGESPVICLEDIDRESSIAEVEKAKKLTEDAINIWLAPLRIYPGQLFHDRFDVYNIDNPLCNRKTNTATVYFIKDDNLKKYCSLDARACAGVEDRTIYVPYSAKQDSYVHEFGHLLGFDDVYIRTDKAEDFRCKAGYIFETTVMCSSSDKLKVADIEGIIDRYCHFYKTIDPWSCP
ncbi:MAG: hypothetical protein HQK53_09450 [Oligoflexia bacterium]|nr:hypothetical protein [Oligoflexia bacterium]